jgi:hypothetical protein
VRVLAGDTNQIDKTEIAFLIAASDGLAAEVYEDMLTKHGIKVIKQQIEPFVPAYIAGDNSKNGVNIYVTKDKLAIARELLDAFESEPYSYGIPIEEHQRKYAQKAFIPGVIIFIIIFSIPVVIAIYAIISSLFFRK